MSGSLQDSSKYNEAFIKSYSEESDEEYFHKDDVQYPEKLHNIHSDSAFWLERMKIEKVQKLVTNLHDKPVFKKNPCRLKIQTIFLTKVKPLNMFRLKLSSKKEC